MTRSISIPSLKPLQLNHGLAAVTLALLLAVPFSVAAQSRGGHAGHGAPVAGKSAGPHDMKTMMQDMNSQMASMPMSGDPDVDFAAMMRIHHIGAVDMAREQLRTGRDPQMRKLAQEILAAQQKEIAIFEKFLAAKGHPVKK